MSQFVRRWESWEETGPGRLSTDRTDRSPVLRPETRCQRTDKTDKSPSVSFVSSLPARVEENQEVGGRCAGCRRHEARGVRVLNCSECGYMAPRRIPKLTEEDLRYPLEYVRQEVPTFAEPYRTRYRAWVEYFEERGWEGEHAERAAFCRVLRWRRPLRCPVGGGRERQMKLVGERGEPASG